jgi:hypothetical protein
VTLVRIDFNHLFWSVLLCIDTASGFLIDDTSKTLLVHFLAQKVGLMTSIEKSKEFCFLDVHSH